ncbi:MAG: transpeptidase family protein [Bacteroidaceae bacterium]|nr:transpeptidase family protein [Bacteroidaceae bacterium]
MFKFKDKIILRFNLLLIFGFFVWGVIIVAKAGIIMTLERQFWLDVAQRAIVYNKPIEPRRGDILSDRGELMVSNLVKYRPYINFDNLGDYSLSDSKREKLKKEKDSIWNANLGLMCEGLARIIPRWTAAEFEAHIKRGLTDFKLGRKGRFGKKKYPLCPDHQLYLSYTQYHKALQLPILNKEARISGLWREEYKYRKKFFGSLANSTLGDYSILGKNKKTGRLITDKHGLDEKYDTILSGVPGLMHTEKEKEIIDIPVEHGMDIQTTLNVEMLDICEKALRRGLTEHGSRAGWVILMEVKTGDIKAIVNLSQGEDGEFIETFRQNKNNGTPNHALADLREPGSIFKPVALAAALEDGKIQEHDSVKSYKAQGGVMVMHGRPIRDAVRPERDYQTVTEVIQNSSNIGMALIINNGYKNEPARFTDKLKKFGMRDNYKLLQCEGTPTFRTPASKSWAESDLQAMSRGYATAQTALNLVTFYNTIANDGKRMAPRLVKAIMRDGEVVEEFEPRVLDEQMLKPSTVQTLKRALSAVVNKKRATGARARSSKVTIAGKTGTALKSEVIDGREYSLLSFCGFFPVENPEYTCIVQNLRAGGGGGGTSAPIFKEIAENIMAKSERRDLAAAKDTINSHTPTAKRGNMTAANYILEELDIETSSGNISCDLDQPTWGALVSDSASIGYRVTEITENTVPNVIGMGAKDALYLMRKAGLRPTISGYGRAVSQSVKPGGRATYGTQVRITLQP